MVQTNETHYSHGSNKTGPLFPLFSCFLHYSRAGCAQEGSHGQAMIFTNKHLVSTPYYEEVCGGSEYKKMEVSVLERLTNLDEKQAPYDKP